jgi:hypothetical protein
MLEDAGGHLFQPSIIVFGEICDADTMEPNPIFLMER